MRINFKAQILPHLIAVVVFLVVTITFFNPIFFDNRSLGQQDIQQWEGSSRLLRDYRAKTGEEGLWALSMFSGMPAYLVNVNWSDGVIVAVKQIFAVGLPHPIINIFWAFLSYYILLLAFKVRPWLAMAGALAFGLSSYLIIGIMVGHNARIGSIAFMPLVMAGIHLAFGSRRILGAGVTALGLALHLRENHLQITYYLMIIVAVYGLVHLIMAIREKTIKAFLTGLAVLVPAVVLAAGTFFGQFWAVTEYSKFSIRGPSELKQDAGTDNTGLSKTYAFEYSTGIWEPMMLFIPNFYGGSAMQSVIQSEESATYKALMQSGDNALAQRLSNLSSSYWGEHPTAAPYYGGAIICFLFVLGIFTAERRYVWWLVPLAVLSIMLSWGDSFKSFNYFMFDYFPGYNKFRSVTFAFIIILFVMPLLGMLGLEKLFQVGINQETKKKLLWAFAFTGGLCVLLFLFAGMGSFLKDTESQLPAWFLNALKSDRRQIFRDEVLRTFSFVLAIFILLYFDVRKRISEFGFYAFLIFMVAIDLSLVDKRYFTEDYYQRRHASSVFQASAADEEILKDKSYYRVFNLQNAWAEARTSYFHYSIGGYHGVKLRRYQDLYDSCISRERNELINDFQQGAPRYQNYGVLNMLNAKYLTYGPDKENILVNPAANGAAWFVKEALLVTSPNEELEKVSSVDTHVTAVIDQSKFQVQPFSWDSLAHIAVTEVTPPLMKYTSSSSANGLAVFSEIYYPKGWHAFIDDKEVPIVRVDYVLRALEIPSGDHNIEFRFEPKPYVIGNKVTFACSWLLVLAVLGSFGWSWKKEAED